RQPAARRALARDAAGDARRGRRALHRARARRGAHRPGQADAGGRLMRAAAPTAPPRVQRNRLTALRPRPAIVPRRPRVAGLYGVGAALPERVIGNDHFEAYLDTSDAWITRRTGIKTRRWLSDGQELAPLAAEACRRALEDAGRRVDEVDHIIVTTI